MMAESNPFAFITKALGNGAPYAYDAIDDLLSRGADFTSALGGEGAAAFNVESCLARWMDTLGGGRNHVVVLGDSNALHEPANTYRWAQALKGDLLTLTGQADGGEGFRHLGLSEWSKSGVWTQLIPPGLSANMDIGPNGQAFYGIDLTATWTWTLPGTFAAHDRWEIYGVDDDFISMQGFYSANGGAFTTTAWDFAPTTGVRLVKQSVSTPITTTLRYRPNGGGVFQSYFVGAAFYNGTTGLIVHNLAQGGNKSADIAGAANTQRLAIMDDLQPKLTILWCGTNDFHHAPTLGIGQVSMQDWYANLTKIVTKARTYGDCLMIYPMASQDPNVFSERPYPYVQADFERVARAVAHQNNCGFLSINQAFGDWVRANSMSRMTDAWHINEAGHRAARKVIKGVITRNS